jgi:hypothetical protein
MAERAMFAARLMLRRFWRYRVAVGVDCDALRAVRRTQLYPASHALRAVEDRRPRRRERRKRHHQNGDGGEKLLLGTAKMHERNSRGRIALFRVFMAFQR